MIRFEGGPAAGQVLSFDRAPVMLRAVRSKLTGKWDVLNDPTDTAGGHEEIFVYRCVELQGRMHVSRRPRSTSFWSSIGTYRYVVEQPGDRVTRGNVPWAAWCEQLDAAEKAGGPAMVLSADAPTPPSCSLFD